MFAIKSLRLNDFEFRDIPDARSLYNALGYKQPSEPVGVDVDIPSSDAASALATNLASTKLAALALADATARKRMEFEKRPSETSALHVDDLRFL
uniref:Uncharacterized protein n=1 Tax=Dulem virus 269 TaxID=3145746 RepID=A0AAU8B5Z9_9VIRU